MRILWLAAMLFCAAVLTKLTNGLTLAFADAAQTATTSEPSTDAKGDDAPPVGTVARVELADKQQEKDLNDRLHFCVFENGDSDYIYVGTKYGMWSRGQFDLTIDGKKIFTGEIKHLVYNGVVLQMGDVLAEQPRSNIGVHITRATGIFK